MKKVIVSAALVALSMVTYSQAQPEERYSSLVFQKYIAKRLSNYSTYAIQGINGTIRVEVKISATGIDEVRVLEGINPTIDEQVVNMIKNTPERIVNGMFDAKQTYVVVPIRLITLSGNE